MKQHPLRANSANDDRIVALERQLGTLEDCKGTTEFLAELEARQVSRSEDWHRIILNGVQALSERLNELEFERSMIRHLLDDT